MVHLIPSEMLDEYSALFRREWENITGSSHVPWALLTQREQDEVRAAVQTASWIVAGLLDADVFSIEAAASLVHESWRSRNWWSKTRLHVPYSKLPEIEKEKDRALVRIILSAMPDPLDSNEK